MSGKQSRNGSKYKKQSRQGTIPLLLGVGGLLLLALAAAVLLRGDGQRPPAGSNPEVSGSPALQVDREQVDLGDVKLGETVNVSFKITNAGDQPLQFQEEPYIEVREGC